MARSGITSTTKNLVDDDGAVMIPLVKGEQLSFDVQLEWLTDLTGYNIHARMVEGLNDGEGTIPSLPKPGGQKRLLSKANGLIIDDVTTDNTFKFVLPWDTYVGLAPQPAPRAPVYLFFELEVGSVGTGDDTAPIGDSAPTGSLVWKPIRGLIELMYSPTED